MMIFRISFRHLTLFMAVLVSFNSNRSLASDSEIKARLAFRVPTDPLGIVSMADYDISLLLSRNWFEYDESRKAIPGLIAKWTFFEKEGGYEFQIDSKAKWSDGTNITPDDLIANLNRAVKRKTSYGIAIAGLIEINRISVKDSIRFFVPTNDGKTAESFFQRMGSIFLAITNPKDWDANLDLKSNTISAGPYKVQATTDSELLLIQNTFYKGSNKNPAKIVRIKKPEVKPNLDLFLKEGSWENIIQTSTLLESNLADQIIKGHFPFWTRGHDRVSLIKPFPGKNIDLRKDFVKFVWTLQPKLKKLTLSLNTKVADCLQPIGYPLFKEIIPKKIALSQKLKDAKFKILAPESFSTRYQV